MPIAQEEINEAEEAGPQPNTENDMPSTPQVEDHLEQEEVFEPQIPIENEGRRRAPGKEGRQRWFDGNSTRETSFIAKKDMVMAGSAGSRRPVVVVTLDGHDCRCSGGRQGLGDRRSGRDERQQASGEEGGCHAWWLPCVVALWWCFTAAEVMVGVVSDKD
ncbi:hypothetical protein L1987_17923 [Smallanthus sonchifolius]|uniref:Uncharacterized protein n=1 Tax=Smallanthus sonchifolius TaxID=185202 RepID=A0ACB9J0B0_9ASTR|nr:hypothetical protein L1987_17923 [Smallanthus sonchifolius]